MPNPLPKTVDCTATTVRVLTTISQTVNILTSKDGSQMQVLKKILRRQGSLPCLQGQQGEALACNRVSLEVEAEALAADLLTTMTQDTKDPKLILHIK